MLDKLKRFLPASLRPKMYLVRLVRRETKCRVQHGPFAGLDLGPDCSWLPALLGTYEKELWPVVSEIVEISPDTIVNIGAAEGYYAVGLLRLLPNAKTVAFEIDDHMRANLGRVVHLNHVRDRISIRGGCDPMELSRVLARDERTLVICDVEGYERELLDPGLVPALQQAYLLVETHEFLRPGISRILRDRFSTTHDIHEVTPVARSAEEFPFAAPYLRLLPKRYRLWAVDEGREGETSWLWMTPRSSR